MEPLWQPAVVESVAHDRVRLRFDRLDQCERCLRGEGCGAGVFSQLFSRNTSVLDLPRHHDFLVGQRVRVGLRPAVLLGGAVLLYGLPLAGFLFGAVLGQAVATATLTPNPLLADLSALAGGLALAALTTWVSWQCRHYSGNPVIEAVSCDPDP